jgi:hypothetical protein
MKLLVKFSIVLIVLFAGCKKYDDDPGKSRLLTVKMRMLYGQWDQSEVYNYKTSTYLCKFPDDLTVEFFRDKGLNSGAYYISQGIHWELKDHKDELEITRRNGTKSVFRITSLTRHNFNFEDDSVKISLIRN